MAKRKSTEKREDARSVDGDCLSLVKDALLSRVANKPFSLDFAVTYRCNARCVQCSIWKHPSKANEELTLGEIQRILDSYRGWKIVGITGGEPFLREDLPYILEMFCVTQPVKLVFVTSNGSLCDIIHKKLFHVIDAYPNVEFKLLISIDGYRELHNKIRGVNIFDNAVRAIRQAVKMRDSLENFEVGTVTVYSPFNFKEFDRVLDVIYDLNVEYDLESTFCMYHVGRYYRNKETASGLEYLEKLKDYLEPMKALLSKRENRFLSVGRKLCWDLVAEWAKEPYKQVIPCFSGRLRYVLDCYGDVYPCFIYNAKIGSLRKCGYDFKKLMKSERAEKIRKLIREGKCDNCCLTCELLPSMMADPLSLAWRLL